MPFHEREKIFGIGRIALFKNHGRDKPLCAAAQLRLVPDDGFTLSFFDEGGGTVGNAENLLGGRKDNPVENAFLRIVEDGGKSQEIALHRPQDFHERKADAREHVRLFRLCKTLLQRPGQVAESLVGGIEMAAIENL